MYQFVLTDYLQCYVLWFGDNHQIPVGVRNILITQLKKTCAAGVFCITFQRVQRDNRTFQKERKGE